MDLNELLFQHQRALMLSARSNANGGGSHFDLVGHYAERIRRLRLDMGVAAWPAWTQA